MKRAQTMTGVLLIVALAYAVPCAFGAVLVRKNLPELVDEAELICLGTVTNVESRWDEHRGVIFSFATVELQRTLKDGEDGSSVVVRYLGGKVGDVGMSAPGTPSFQVGEDVLLFLTPEEDGTYSVVGMSQGKYAIEYDESSGTEYANPELSGVMLIQESDEPEPGRVPLSDLLGLIDALVGSGE